MILSGSMGDLGYDPPGWLIDAVNEATSTPEVQEGLENAGQALAAKVLPQAAGGGAPSKPLPAWVSKLTDPIVDPILRGVTTKSTPVLLAGGLALVLAGAGLGYLLTRKTRQT